MGSLVRRGFLAALALTLVGTAVAEASGPRRSRGRRAPTRMKTEVETEARLVGVGSQGRARGEAEHEEETVTVIATGETYSETEFEVSVSRLTLATGSVVSFQLNGTEVGSGTVRFGRASMKLKSEFGDSVPDVVQGDTLTVLDADGNTILTGTFRAPKTEVEYK